MTKRTFGEPGVSHLRVDLREQMYRIVCGKGSCMVRRTMSRADAIDLRICPLCGEACGQTVVAENEIAEKTNVSGMFTQEV